MAEQLDPGSAEWWLDRLGRRLAERQSGRVVNGTWTPGSVLYDDYYHGRHRLRFLTRTFLEAFNETFRELRFNYCEVVVDSLNERLEVQGFRFGDDQRAADAAWAIWQANGLDASFTRGVRESLIKGETSLIVWADAAGEPIITVEDAHEVIVATDPGDRRRRRAALKVWWDEDEGQMLATVYLPASIHKYRAARSRLSQRGGQAIRQGFGWEPRMVDDEPWPLPNPLGVVPVVPIPNKPNLAGVGQSELVAIVPVQDGINANLVSLMLAGQLAAFRQRWAVNVELEIDPDTGKPKEPWTIAMDRLLTAPPPEEGELPVQFGEFGQTDLAGFVKTHELAVQATATLSRTPPHYFLGSSGVFPSGESLRSAETGLVAKANDRIQDNRGPVAEAVRLAFLLKAKQPGTSSRDAGRFTKWSAMTGAAAWWRDPESRTESEHVDALVKQKALNVPDEILLEKVPYSPQEIERIKAIWAAGVPRETPPDDAGTDGTGTITA